MLRYTLFAIASTALVILAWLFSPILSAISVAFNLKRLPFGLQYFSTVDDDLDGGQHQNHYPAHSSRWELWWQRTRWIIRNPAQGFQVYWFGYSATGYYLVLARVGSDGVSSPYRVWKNAKGHTLFAYQPRIDITRKYYVKMWYGWAKKENINRFSFKFVPFSIGVNK